MSKLIRSSQRIFAGSITPTGNVAVFGSLAASAPAYSNDPDTIQSLAAWTNGWASATVGSKSPAFQDFNGYQYVVTRQLAYMFQAGLPEWHSTTIYFTGSWCQSAGIAYVSRTDNNTNNAVTDTVNWMTLKQFLGYAAVATSGAYADLSGRPSLAPVAISGLYSDLTGIPPSCKAWATFDASGSGARTILAGSGVTSVSGTSGKLFTITLSSTQPNSNYSVVASCTDFTIRVENTQTTTTFQLTPFNGAINPTFTPKVFFQIFGA